MEKEKITIEQGVVGMNEQIEFEYYYGEEAEQFNFLMLPKFLLKEPRFAQLSDTSKILYSMMLERMGIIGTDGFHTIHNYIDTEEMILRKGAIAAHKGERVLIPINMRDGSILAFGKGNPEWNYSAPHGAGRIMSRTRAKNELDMEEYQKAMEGIYTTSVNEYTLDEAPMAYKSLSDIIDVIGEAVDIIEVLKPIYNFKASN